MAVGRAAPVRWLAPVGVALSLTLGLVTPALAAGPTGVTPNTAIPLTKSASGNLVGSSGGSFVYYAIPYSGDGSQVTVNLTANPAQPDTVSSVGINFWQSGNMLTSTNALGVMPGQNSVTVSSTTPGPILAQVYNYLPGTPESYQISVSGLAPVTPPAVAAPVPSPVASTPATSPTTAVAGATAQPAGSVSNPIRLGTWTTGKLNGAAGGNYLYYTLPYAGDGSTQTLNVFFSPPGQDASTAFYVTVYQNGVQLASSQASAGAAPGQFQVFYSSTTAGPVLIQVANYSTGIPVSFGISH